MRLVAVGEDRAAELEQHEVEGGLEVPGELRLGERRPDRPEIVGKADADTGFLARLGLAVLRQVHGSGHGRPADASGIGSSPGFGGMAVAVIAVTGCGAGVSGGFRFLRHVLGPDQAMDDLERAVASDGGDAAGDPEILAPIDGAGLDPALNLVEAFLDDLGLADQLLGPGIVVKLGEDSLACLQLLDLGLLFRRALGRLGDRSAHSGRWCSSRPRPGPWPTSSGSRARP